MENRIVYRPYKRSDYDVLKNIVRKTWNYDRFAEPKIAEKMSRIALNSCLGNQTFTNVAAVSGVPVGIVMGRNIESHKKKVVSSMKTGMSIFSLLKKRRDEMFSRCMKASAA